MAGKLKPVTWKTLVRKLHNLGFNGPYIGGKHHFMTKAELRLTIPNPHTGDINVPLLSEILARGGISRSEWLKI
ncbi:MAG: type II toxin-antitoxin system HicA family toxin [Dehalococcoidia bacterium]|jgi:predicted RNA binding protein YcfA (HicA-like mRNA interferase family)